MALLRSCSLQERPNLLRLSYVAIVRGRSQRRVPRSVYEGLLAADSKGKYLNLMVKGIYRYERIY